MLAALIVISARLVAILAELSVILMSLMATFLALVSIFATLLAIVTESFAISAVLLPILKVLTAPFAELIRIISRLLAMLMALSKISAAYLIPGDQEFLDTKGLTYMYGAGTSATFGAGTTYGVEGFAGLNYKIANVPFGLRLDWRPGVYFVSSDMVTELGQFGFNVIVYIDEF